MSTVLGYVVVALPADPDKDGSVVSSLSADRSDAEFVITAYLAEVPAAARKQRLAVGTVTVDVPAVTG